MRINENTVQVSGDTDLGTIESGIKNGPEGATNTGQGLAASLGHIHTDKEGLPVMVPENRWHLVDREFAVYLLEVAQKDFEHAKHMRLYYAQNARQHGITYKRIGQIYGVTEGAIRKMLKKADS